MFRIFSLGDGATYPKMDLSVSINEDNLEPNIDYFSFRPSYHMILCYFKLTIKGNYHKDSEILPISTK